MVVRLDWSAADCEPSLIVDDSDGGHRVPDGAANVPSPPHVLRTPAKALHASTGNDDDDDDVEELLTSLRKSLEGVDDDGTGDDGGERLLADASFAVPASLHLSPDKPSLDNRPVDNRPLDKQSPTKGVPAAAGDALTVPGQAGGAAVEDASSRPGAADSTSVWYILYSTDDGTPYYYNYDTQAWSYTRPEGAVVANEGAEYGEQYQQQQQQQQQVQYQSADQYAAYGEQYGVDQYGQYGGQYHGEYDSGGGGAVADGAAQQYGQHLAGGYGAAYEQYGSGAAVTAGASAAGYDGTQHPPPGAGVGFDDDGGAGGVATGAGGEADGGGGGGDPMRAMAIWNKFFENAAKTAITGALLEKQDKDGPRGAFLQLSYSKVGANPTRTLCFVSVATMCLY